MAGFSQLISSNLVWFGGFYGISTFVGYLMQIHFYVNNLFYLKQFSLTWVHSLIVKNISISNYSSSYIQFSLNTVSMSKIVQLKTIQFSKSTQFKCKYSLIVKKTFLFRAIQFSQAILFQLIQFSISTDFVYKQLHVRTVLY